MKVLIMPDGTEKNIISETDRYYKTEDSQYKKIFWLKCTKEILDEKPEEDVTEEQPKQKKTAKKTVKKSEEKEA